MAESVTPVTTQLNDPEADADRLPGAAVLEVTLTVAVPVPAELVPVTV